MSSEFLIWLVVIGGLMFLMHRGGGCCGGHRDHHGHHGHSHGADDSKAKDRAANDTNETGGPAGQINGTSTEHHQSHHQPRN